VGYLAPLPDRRRLHGGVNPTLANPVVKKLQNGAVSNERIATFSYDHALTEAGAEDLYGLVIELAEETDEACFDRLQNHAVALRQAGDKNLADAFEQAARFLEGSAVAGETEVAPVAPQTERGEG